MTQNNLFGLTRTAILSLLVLAVSAAPVGADATEAPQKQSIIFQVSDNNPVTWNQTLSLAANIALMGKEKVEVEIVAFGQGMGMLKLDSEVGSRLKQAAENSVALRACGLTMKKMKLSEADLYPDSGIKVVPSGMSEILKQTPAVGFHIRPLYGYTATTRP